MSASGPSGPLVLSCFGFCGAGSSFIHTSKHFIHMNLGSQQPDKRA